MNKLIWLGAIVFALAMECYAVEDQNEQNKDVALQQSGIPVEEVIVQSNLNVRKKPQPVRQTRSVVYIYPVNDLILAAHRRQKRQFNPNFGASSSAAQANANAFNFRPGGGFDTSNAFSNAQGFQNRGPLGSFGANSAGAFTDNFSVGPNGVNGGASFSESQNYDLPNGHHLNLALAQGFTIGPDGKPVRSNSNAINYT